jgi:hypothetical protein
MPESGSRPTRAWLDANLRMNDILTVGTHNSYKQAISEPILELLRGGSPDGRWQALDYSHPPLTDQLDDGARALELDVFYDPDGGRYAHPAGMLRTNQPIPTEYVSAMSKPGFKVIHIQDLDFRSSVPTLVEGLTVIRDWSDGHPDHVPILITMNTSDGPRRMRSGVDGLPFTTEAYDALDAEVASVFPPDKLIRPDDIRGDFPTLRQAVLERGWPRLGEARGRFLFAIDETGHHREAYRGGRRNLEGRIYFVYSDEEADDGAYITLNETADVPRITAAVKAGLIVRTRADADTWEARANDVTRRNAALLSGAQYVSTDYRYPDPRLGNDYQVRLPGNAIAVVNPQRAPDDFGGAILED